MLYQIKNIRQASTFIFQRSYRNRPQASHAPPNFDRRTVPPPNRPLIYIRCLYKAASSRAVAAGRFPACLLTAQASSNAEKFSPPTRTFRFTYNLALAVKDIPAGVQRGRVWVLRPQTDQHQTVRVVAEQGSRQNADDPRTRLWQLG